MSTLHLDHVTIALGERQLLAVDTVVQPGETLTIMGPSGVGKSSLLAYIGGFLDNAFTASGAVRMDGEDLTQLPSHARRTGILFQDPLLFPHMSVAENLLFAMPRAIKERAAKAEEALAQAGLDGFSSRDPATLSGGQKARVALMRVLLAQPRCLLLDEPFSKLDTERRANVRGFVFGEAQRLNLPVVMVTHDAEDAHAAMNATGGEIIDLAANG
ncbi:ATP-binding cassette domain-containing protein [Ahrensia sp. R2A130]|uniref:ATP-binding cassette domain-containing protein n=1 Tax=Ahrensia sp. R2A130 TaxID=744979 RepID=UPI0001E0F845|nr:ATP-binding cassette domain-containing protein [Ahrensia sp. R2A130]EFL89916.1 spermidine/putrescine import ATP-binding protein PotA [Ahrensia sp. R2A130]